MRDKLKIGDRFKRYADKFRKPIETQPVKNKETLGELIVAEVSKAIDKRLKEIIPLVAAGGSVKIQCNSGSFWEAPKKQLTVFVLVEFDENVKWKSEEDIHDFPLSRPDMELRVADFCEECRPHLHEVPDISIHY